MCSGMLASAKLIRKGCAFSVFSQSQAFRAHHRLSKSFFACLHVRALVVVGVCDLYMDCTIHSDLKRVKK